MFAIGMLMLFAEGLVGQSSQSSSLASLVETERAFAAMSPAKGMKAAFLTYLADDGLLFRPGPVNGKQVWRKRPDSSSVTLEWEPIFADVSASGDLGYTTGPWVLTPGPNLDQPPAHGFFVSVWKKQKSGQWKLAVDLGIGNEHPEKVNRTFSTPTSTTSKTKCGNMKVERSRLLKLEQRFSRLAKSGSSMALKELAGVNLRIYRDGDVPAVGFEESLTKLTAVNEKLSLHVEKCVVASSCDLAYTYVKYDDVSRPSTEVFSGYFVHIWKKDTTGNWKLALDILNPPPPVR